MSRIAVVVQRADRSITGGSEGYALKLAKVLAERHDVDILTTTAIDNLTWANVLDPGDYELDNHVRIKRFKVDIGKGAYWHSLNNIMFRNVRSDDFSRLNGKEKAAYVEYLRKLPFGFCEEWIKFQGPFSGDLLEFLGSRQDEYVKIVFVTYLYPTAYFGVDRIKDTGKIRVIPTYHDEAPAYLIGFRKYTGLTTLFLTRAEKDIAERELFNRPLNGAVIGFGFEDNDSGEYNPGSEQYVLYAGRLEDGKGVLELYDYFERYVKQKNKLKLYTIGDGELKEHKHSSVVYKGFVSEREKYQLMKNALAFIHPSAYESFGIVLAEAFMMGTPAVVNAQSKVLFGHINDSRAGFAYSNYEEFEKALDVLLNEPSKRTEFGTNARKYYLDNYSEKAFKDRVSSLIG